MTRHFSPRWAWPCLSILLIALATLGTARAQTNTSGNTNVPAAAQADYGGPVRLRSTPQQLPQDPLQSGTAAPMRQAETPPQPYVPGEFERYVQRLADPAEAARIEQQANEPRGDNARMDVRPSGREVRRFGSELVTGAFDGRGEDLSPLVPPEYTIAPGDEILLTLWGSVDADLRLIVDRGGRISVPRVGAIQVSGVRYVDLPAVVDRRVAQVFKNFQFSVSLGQLRGIRVFVTGFVVRPGTYTVSALSTVVGALMRAGGPSAAGSFRHIELRRGSALVARFDLYDLLLKGDRSADRLVQAGDVVHVNAVGPQVGVIGSVNRPAVVELTPDETVADALRVAGGFSAVADRSRMTIERLLDRQTQRVTELSLPRDATVPLNDGDVLRAFSATDALLSIVRQNKVIRVEGEVARPGEYVMPPASSIADAIQAAGGLTAAAYVFGTEFTRESVRKTQQVNYERVLRDLETEFTRATATQRTSNAEEAAVQGARNTATDRLISSLRAVRPNGRIVLQLPPDSRELPDLALEDGDRLYIPPRTTTIGVFGSVFNGGSYLFSDGRNIGEYLRLAGGPTRGADAGSTFVIRANGSVVSSRQSGNWFGNNEFAALEAEPGDTVFVPEEMEKTTFFQYAKDWTQILSQFALGVAAIQVLNK